MTGGKCKIRLQLLKYNAGKAAALHAASNCVDQQDAAKMAASQLLRKLAPIHSKAVSAKQTIWQLLLISLNHKPGHKAPLHCFLAARRIMLFSCAKEKIPGDCASLQRRGRRVVSKGHIPA